LGFSEYLSAIEALSGLMTEINMQMPAACIAGIATILMQNFTSGYKKIYYRNSR